MNIPDENIHEIAMAFSEDIKSASLTEYNGTVI